MAYGQDFCNKKAPQARFSCEKTVLQARLIKKKCAAGKIVLTES